MAGSYWGLSVACSRNSSFRGFLALIPLAIGGSFPREVSHWLDAARDICLTIVIIVIIIFIVWVASMLFGGSGRG